MNKLLGALALGLALLNTSAFAQTPHKVHCSDATLHGTVMVALERSINGTPASAVTMESWDGTGHLQYREIDNGTSWTSGLYAGTGTYSISSDCIATVHYDGDTTDPWHYYIDPDGRGYAWVNEINTGRVASSHAELVSRELLVQAGATTAGPCSTATLSGTYTLGLEESVNGVPMATAGFQTFDGAGTGTYRRTITDGYTTSVVTGSMTYSLTDRCIASVYFDGASSPTLFFVSPDGSAYFFATDGSTGTILAGKVLRSSRAVVAR